MEIVLGVQEGAGKLFLKLEQFLPRIDIFGAIDTGIEIGHTYPSSCTLPFSFAPRRLWTLADSKELQWLTHPYRSPHLVSSKSLSLVRILPPGAFNWWSRHASAFLLRRTWPYCGNRWERTVWISMPFWIKSSSMHALLPAQTELPLPCVKGRSSGVGHDVVRRAPRWVPNWMQISEFRASVCAPARLCAVKIRKETSA